MQTLEQALEGVKNVDISAESLISTGFPKLDSAMNGGLSKGIHLIGGRPGMGTQDFMIDLAISSCSHHDTVLATTLQTPEMIADKIKRHITPENKHRINSTKLKVDQIQTRTRSINEFVKECRRENIEFALVDLSNPVENTVEIAETLTSLQDLDIPVVASVSLANPISTTEPQLSDLQSLGYISPIIKSISLLYRAEFFGLTEDENGHPTEGFATLFVYNRFESNPTTIQLQFDHETGRFSE